MGRTRQWRKAEWSPDLLIELVLGVADQSQIWVVAEPGMELTTGTDPWPSTSASSTSRIQPFSGP